MVAQIKIHLQYKDERDRVSSKRETRSNSANTFTVRRHDRTSFQPDSTRRVGVVINDRITAADHVSGLLTSCSRRSRLLNALRVLRSHGISATSMSDIFRSKVLAKLLYCAPAWSGFCSAADRVRLEAFLRRRHYDLVTAIARRQHWPRCSMRLMSHCSLAS